MPMKIGEKRNPPSSRRLSWSQIKKKHFVSAKSLSCRANASLSFNSGSDSDFLSSGSWWTRGEKLWLLITFGMQRLLLKSIENKLLMRGQLFHSEKRIFKKIRSNLGPHRQLTKCRRGSSSFRRTSSPSSTERRQRRRRAESGTRIRLREPQRKPATSNILHLHYFA